MSSQAGEGFFQGFDFGMTQYDAENAVAEIAAFAASDSRDFTQVSEKITKEFSVLKLIDAYRTRGHLFTKTNPVRDRRTYTPTLDIENYGLSQSDLNTVFDAAKAIKIAPCSLQEILNHLNKIYCQSIGVEYMYIRKPEVIQWIQDKIGYNDNIPKFSVDEKKTFLKN